MGFLNEEFNINDLPHGTGSFDPLPAGWYSATITKADLTATKDGNGQYIKIRYDITGPTHQGRVVFGNLNIRNSSQKAEEIGRQQLGDIMRAIGMAKVRDTDQLIGYSLDIKLEIKEDEKYGASNEVKRFKASDGSAAPVTQISVSSAPSVAASSAKVAPPWAKK